jgi:hypothetical protein
MVALRWTGQSVATGSPARARQPVRRHPSGRTAGSGPARSSDPAPSLHPAGAQRARSLQPASTSRRGGRSSSTAPAQDARPARLSVVRDTSAVASPPRARPNVVASRRRRVFFRRRVLLVAAIAGLGAAGWAAGGWLVQVAGAQATGMPVQHVYVARPGDTIWGIAVRFSGGGAPGPLAYKLEQQIGGGVLQPGDQLDVP